MNTSRTDLASARRVDPDGSAGHGSPQIVFPAVGDKRIQVPNPPPNPYRSVGQIVTTFPAGSFGQPVANGPVRSRGTATVCDLTGYYLVTAAHNFVALDDVGISPTPRKQVSSLYYPPGGAAPIPIKNYQLVYGTEYMGSVVPYEGTLPFDDITAYCYDLAVAELQTPVAPSSFGRAGAAPNELDWSRAWPAVPPGGPAPALPAGPPWSPQVTGYPGDKPQGTMWTAGGNAAGGPPSITLDLSTRLLFYQIATFAGQSGGPVWGAPPGSAAPQQIGVHLGMATDGANGPNLTNVAIWLSQQRNDDIRNAIALLYR